MSPRTSAAKRKSYKEQSQSDIDGSSDASLDLPKSSDEESLDDDSNSQPAKKRKPPLKEKKSEKGIVNEKLEKKGSAKSNQNIKTVSEKADGASASMRETHISIGMSASSSIDITQGPPIATDTAAKKLVLQYMKQQNRPYSMIQMHDNLHKRIPKATLDRVLNTMSGAGGELVCKEYGKSKIYYVDQSTFAGSVKEDQLEDLQIENEELKKEVQEIVQEEKRFQTELVVLQKEPADEDLERVITEVRDKVNEKRKKVENLSTAMKSNSDPQALIKTIKKFNAMRQSWFQRKSMCIDAIDLLAEAMGKKAKEIMNDLSLEQDEGPILPPIKESAVIRK